MSLKNEAHRASLERGSRPEPQGSPKPLGLGPSPPPGAPPQSWTGKPLEGGLGADFEGPCPGLLSPGRARGPSGCPPARVPGKSSGRLGRGSLVGRRHHARETERNPAELRPQDVSSEAGRGALERGSDPGKEPATCLSRRRAETDPRPLLRGSGGGGDLSPRVASGSGAAPPIRSQRSRRRRLRKRQATDFDGGSEQPPLPFRLS